jgi:hypothetical protein
MANYNKSFNFRNGVQVDDDNFIVNANGLVGIGTSIPREFLDVYGTAKVTGLVTTTNLYVSGVTTVSNLKVGNVSISSGIVTASTGIVTYYGNGGNLLNLPTSQWVDVDSGFGYTSIYAAGNVGIATTYPNYTFQVGGNTVTSNGVGFNSTGDVYISGIVTATTASITNTTTTNLTSTASTTTSLRVSGTGSIATLNAVTGVVTTISGTNLTYSGTGSLGTLNAVTGVVTTISGTTATYTTANITTLNSTTTGTIENLTSTNINAAGIITATNGFRGALTGTASSATQLVTSRNFSITGSFVTASAISFNGTGNVALAATITANSIGLGTHTTGNYVRSISGTDNQIVVVGSASPGDQPQILLSNDVIIYNDLYVANNIGIGTTIPAYNLHITAGNGSGVGISTLGNINATGIITASTFSGTATYAGYATTAGISTVSQGLTGTPNISVGIITATTLKVGTGVTVQSGIVTATNGFSSGIGTAVQITTVGNQLIFTVAGVGATSLTLF